MRTGFLMRYFFLSSGTCFPRDLIPKKQSIASVSPKLLDDAEDPLNGSTNFDNHRTPSMSTLVTALSSSSSSPAIIIPSTNLQISCPSLQKHISDLQSNLASLGVAPGSAVSISLIN